MLSVKLPVILFTITLTTSFQFGYQTGVINSPLHFISDFIRNVSKSRGMDVDDDYVTTVSSLCVTGFLIGGMIGALISGLMANKLGRKKSLLILSIPCLLGCTVIMISKVASSFELIIIGRLLIGFACGAFTGIGPMYMSEIAPCSIRGAAGVLNQLVVVISITLSQILGLPMIMNRSELWPYLLGLNIIPCAIGALGLFFCPESPQYLYLIKNDPISARNELLRIRNETADIDSELDIFQKESERKSQKVGISNILKIRHLRFALFVTIVAQIGQQLSGMNGLLYYSAELFKSNGLDNDQSTYASLGVGGVLLVVTIISVFVIDRWGRRPLLIGGLVDAFVCLLIFTASMIGKQVGNVNWLIHVALVSIYVFVCGFAIGPGSIPWFLAAELFPQECRDSAIAVSVTANWICNIAVGLGFIQLIKYWGIYSFLPFVVILFVAIVLLSLYMPETMGRSIDAIEDDLKRRSRPHRRRYANVADLDSSSTVNTEEERLNNIGRTEASGKIASG